MENKKNYITPEVEVIVLELEDVLTGSVTFDPNGDLGGSADGWY